MLTSSHILLKNVKFHAFHGVMPQERNTGGDFTVNLSVEVDLQKAALTDRVEETVNYAVLYQILQEEMNIHSNLLEHVAGRVANRVMDRFPDIQTVEVEIMKNNPPIRGECEGAAVKMTFKKQ